MAQLSKKIKEIFEIIGDFSGRPNEDDAMLSRRPLGPVACASCEKGLTNIIGMPVDYYTWKRMPARDPSERIARYGQGFSKILSHMRVGSEGPSPHKSRFG